MKIVVKDMYEGVELLYKGASEREAKKAIKERVEDTSGECAFLIKVTNICYPDMQLSEELKISITDSLYNYAQECYDEIAEYL